MKTKFLVYLSTALSLSAISPITSSPKAHAVTLFPSDVNVSSLSGSNNGSRTGTSASQAFVDDILLNTITFGSTTFDASTASIQAVQRAGVVLNRQNINAEFGDQDNNSDGNPNPFVRAGVASEGDDLGGTNNPIRESTDPAIQDPAIQSAFATTSLNEGIDGEGGPFSFDLIFQSGLIDNDQAVDSVPELLFVERGVNSDFNVQAIIGGTFESPIFAPITVSVFRDPLAAAASNIFINTTEINNGQELGFYGLDITDFFGSSSSVPVFGVRISTFNNSGPDLYGTFISAADPSQLRPVPEDLSGASVPEPQTLAGLLAIATLGIMRKSRKA